MAKPQQGPMLDSAVDIYNACGSHPIVLVREHASAAMPSRYRQLGLTRDLAVSHIAFDPGAQGSARYLADKLNVVLVAGTVSRLIYDLNRPPESSGALTPLSECHAVPGNRNLEAPEQQHRIETYYLRFVSTVAQLLNIHSASPVRVTVHSVTPVYNGYRREVEPGILHDANVRLADAMFDGDFKFNVQRNRPYGPQDGVTPTLKLHGLANLILNVMIEIRKILIADDAACGSMATYLSQWLNQVLRQLPHIDDAALSS